MSTYYQQEASKETIDSFSGVFHFLSNFYRCRVDYEGISYPSSEHAYQAAKTFNTDEKKEIAKLTTAAKAKKAGKKISIRDDWDDIKVDVMREIIDAKFTQNPLLREMLLATDDLQIVEGNHWGDTFWGVCRGKGQNHLGEILMELRDKYAKSK